jgi:fatty-acyl-CoA synthase
MYLLNLTESHAPATSEGNILEHSVGSLLAEQATRNGTQTALQEVCQDGSLGRAWTYAELHNDARRLASWLGERYAVGEKVVVWSPNSPEWVLMEYGCALAGLVLVTANPAFQVRELRYVLEQSGAVGLFIAPEFRGNPMQELAAEAVVGLTAVRETVDMLTLPAQIAGIDPGMVELPAFDPTAAAQVQYTSGTTGFPKGAVLSHRALVNNARFYASRCGVDRASVWINIMPMFHTSGCGMVTLGCLQAGCKMVLVSLFDPKVVVPLIETQRASIILGVPTMVLALLEQQEQQPVDASSLQVVSCGGANVAPELVRRVQAAFGATFSTLYGQTESSPVITQHHLDDSIDDICNTIGQPLAHTAVSIRSVDENAVVALDTVGEICALGPCTMNEYHDNPEATAQTIDAQGWLHTGDLGRMDARGYVTITGRVKDMIIRGGENHFPAEIENALLEHSDVSDVQVVGIPDEKWGEVIAAFIRAEAGVVLDKDELHKHCRGLLSPQKTPTVWVQVEAFPMTGSGKVQKFKLREGYLAGDYLAM